MEWHEQNDFISLYHIEFFVIMLDWIGIATVWRRSGMGRIGMYLCSGIEMGNDRLKSSDFALSLTESFDCIHSNSRYSIKHTLALF